MDKVVHFEIRVDNLERAKRFYDLFGWQLQDIPGEMDYTAVTTVPTDDQYLPVDPGAINGSMFKRKKGEPTNATITIEVNSIDDCVNKIESSGGRITMPKTEMPNMGFYAYFKDTEGNTIGLWENLK